MPEWYEELFQDYASSYEKECFTQGTLGEVNFIEQEINKDKQCRIIDIGCGTGRHSIELAKRGYTVTGVDLSAAMLAKAEENAKKAGVKVTFLRQDARSLDLPNRYDLALILCEGAFPLMETDEMNFMILKNAAACLGKNGKLILTTLNGLFPLFHSVKDFINAESKTGTASLENSFDLLTFRDHSLYEIVDDKGIKKALRCNERYYVPPEISWLLKSLGFATVAFFGCNLGAWSREDPLSVDDYEMLVVAEK